jgi:putative ABC transport system permease protein
MWTDFRQDATYAIRSLRKAPGLLVTALITLALGIGANTAIFSVINGVLLRPLPYPDEERLVFLWSTAPAYPRMPLTPGQLLDFRQQMTTAAGVAGISHIALTLTGVGEPERLSASSVSSSFFDVLGVPPLLGDPFHAGRAAPDDVVLSHALWLRRFGGDRSIVGRRVVMNSRPRTIVAVMPPEFEWPAITAQPGSFDGPEAWVPAAQHEIPRTPVDDPNQDMSQNRRSGYLRAIVRLQPHVTRAQAQAEVEAIATRLGEQHPTQDGQKGALLVPLRTQFVGHVRQPLFILLGAVAFILAMACANIASLLLGQSVARRGEMAMRLALGASRSRIMRQMLTEAMVLACAGGLAGLAVAWIVQRALVAFAPGGLPGLEHVGIDARVLAFSAVVAIGTGVVCGLVPALQSSRASVTAELGETGTRSSGGARTRRTRDALVAVQFAAALVLLVGAVLLLRSFTRLARVDTGIVADNVLAFDIQLSGERAEYQQRQRVFYEQLFNELRAVPGVIAAGGAATLPIGGDDFGASYVIEGAPEPAPGSAPSAGYQVVMPGYFDTLGIPLKSGRHFATSDTDKSQPVAMINETFARRNWADADPIGRRIKMGSGPGPWMTVIGVVGDYRHMGPSRPPRPEIYQSYSQTSFPFAVGVVKTAGDPMRILPALKAAVARLDPNQPLANANTMQHHIERALSRPRFMSTLIGAFGIVALLLATVGIYGVMSWSVAQRTREIAIRSALGAKHRDVVGMILKKALVVAAIGIAVGLAGAVWLSGTLRGLLFDVAPDDPLTYAGVACVLALTAVAAATIPAVRATRIHSVQVLR